MKPLLLLLLFSTLALADKQKVAITHKVFLDFALDGEPVGRVVVGLLGRTVPKTVQNYVDLVTHAKGFGYKGSNISKIVENFYIQGGDFDGKGGRAANSLRFEDENLKIKSFGAGTVSMMTHGADDNGSEFILTLAEIPWFDGKYQVFGKVIRGMEVLRKVEKVEVDITSRPKQHVYIENCGLLRRKH